MLAVLYLFHKKPQTTNLHIPIATMPGKLLSLYVTPTGDTMRIRRMTTLSPTGGVTVKKVLSPPSLVTLFAPTQGMKTIGCYKPAKRIEYYSLPGAQDPSFPHKICLVSFWNGKEVREYAGFVCESHCLQYYKDLQKVLDVMWKYILHELPLEASPSEKTCKAFLKKLGTLIWKWEKSMVPYDVRQFYEWLIQFTGRKVTIFFHPPPTLRKNDAKQLSSSHKVTSSHRYSVEGMVGNNFHTISPGQAFDCIVTGK